MNIVEPYARILHLDPDALKRIEFCARISHRSEDLQREDSWERFITAVVLQHGDWSVVEHAHATVDFLVDRGITHEIVRHRLFSFTQESTRFVNYAKKMPPTFIKPVFGSEHSQWSNEAERIWVACINSCEEAYRALLGNGASPQLARSVFPNALASRIVMTGNLRNWRHFLIMRCTKEAHPQMREVTIPLLIEFQSRVPLLYADIQPGMRQVDALKLPR
jgi:thymidylate synthase (FAD)